VLSKCGLFALGLRQPLVSTLAVHGRVGPMGFAATVSC
jgi:hypothetical protein